MSEKNEVSAMRRIYVTSLIIAYKFCLLIVFFQILFFHCLDFTGKLHEDVKEIKKNVQEMNQALQKRDNCQNAPMATEDRIGRPYFSLLLWIITQAITSF